MESSGSETSAASYYVRCVTYISRYLLFIRSAITLKVNEKYRKKLKSACSGGGKAVGIGVYGSKSTLCEMFT